MKYLKSLMLVLAIISILCVPVPVSATSQGTNGTELEVMQPENLEIFLGETWAGEGFTLKTDAGMYPDTILVGGDGVLRLELGGSSTYYLAHQESKVPTVQETVPEGTEAAASTEESAETTEETAPTEIIIEEENTVAGIPMKQLIIFVAGLVIAVIVLVALVMRNQKNTQDVIDENDEF